MSSKMDYDLALISYEDQYEALKDSLGESQAALSESRPSGQVLESCAKEIQRTLDRYEECWPTYRGYISTETGLLNAKMREHRAVSREARKAKKDVLDRLANLNISVAPTVPNVPSQHNPLPMPKLPSINIPTFSGLYHEWPAFWDLYTSLVHNRTDISAVMKFSILRSRLGGNALRIIEGLSITNANYDVAVKILRETYEDNNRLSRSLIKELSNLPSPRHNYEELLNFRLSYQKLLMQIENSGTHIDQLDPILTSTITQKLSSETSKLLIQKYSTFDLTLDQISEGLKYVLALFEYCQEKDDGLKVKSNNAKVATVISSSDSKANSKNSSKVKAVKGQQQKPVSAGHKSFNTSNQYKPCTFCKANHASKYCSDYPTVDSRKTRIKELKLCFACLQPGHVSSDCRVAIKCRHCDGSHHTFLCYKLFNVTVINPSRSTDVSQEASQGTNPKSPGFSNSDNHVPESQSSSQPVSRVQLSVAAVHNCSDSVLIPTAIPTATVRLSGGGTCVEARSMLDTGSQRTFICSSLVRDLNIQPHAEMPLTLTPFGSEPTSAERTIVKVVVRLGKTRVTLKAVVSDQMNTSIHSPGLGSVAKALRSKGIKLADRHLDGDEVDNVRLLIGVDYFHVFAHNQWRTMGVQLFSTSGGALISGPMPRWAYANQSSSSVVTQSVFCGHVSLSEARDEIQAVSDLWSLDAIGIKPVEFSPEEKATVQQLEQSIQFKDDGYSVSLPFKSECRPPTNYRVALGQLNSLMRKFKEDPILWNHYQNILSDYLERGFIEIVPSPGSIKGHYLPYHHVRKESTTTPIRLVFDASSKSAGALSLNDCLNTGPSITNKLYESLLAFRTNPLVVLSDISKAFLRIKIDEPSRDWCRFLWITDPSDPNSIVTFKFCVVMFGARSSPYILQGTLDYHLRHHPNSLAKSLTNYLYVDNFMKTYENLDKMFEEYPVINEIFNDAHMPLQEWISNNVNFNKFVGAEELIKTKEGIFSVLGILWNIHSDMLSIRPCKIVKSTITKRSILSCVSSVFDPLGLVSPVVILGKILVSDLWKLNCKWDDKVTEEFEVRFKYVRDELSQIDCIEFPRFVVVPGRCQLHVFCDASEKAFGAVAYSVDLSFQTSNLLVSKARVCPQQKLTIPKLELTSVNIGCKLAHTLMNNSSFRFESRTVWSDSEATIGRIKNNRCKESYVRNRVREIKDLHFPVLYVSTKENPADLLSRGTDVKKLAGSSLWRHGPSWLVTQEYPPQKECLVDTSVSVSVNEITVEPINIEPNPVIIKVDSYSSLAQVKRIMRLMLRIINYAVGYNFTLDPLLYLLRLEQLQQYPNVIAYLKNPNLNVSADIKNFVRSLNLYLDVNNLARARGRIQNANLSDSARFPYLLPPKSHLAKLIVRYLHINNNHCGVSVLIVLVREQFWIPKGRQIIKTLVNDCVTCRRVCGKPATLPGPPPLPEERVTYVRPFYCVGIDYTGAIAYVDNDDAEIEYKSYICLFTCASSRAVHLELVASLSAADFLLAFRRFSAVFSVPSVIITDNAKNFTGFSQFWHRLFEEPEVKSYMENHSVQWRFSIPRSPWKGGFFERMIGITKGCLSKALYRKIVTYDELRTLLTEFTALINNRPLTYITEDSDEVLTPNHLIYGRNICLAPPLNALAEDEIPFAENIDLRVQYSKLSDLLRKFEKSWNSDYLTALREKHYNCVDANVNCPFKVGDVVLVNLDNCSRKWWPLGRVQTLISGPDGVIRSVEVTVGSKVYHRSLNKLVPLEVDTSETVLASEVDTPESEPASEEGDVASPQLQLPNPVVNARPLRKAAADCNVKRKALINEQLL